MIETRKSSEEILKEVKATLAKPQEPSREVKIQILQQLKLELELKKLRLEIERLEEMRKRRWPQ